MFEAIDHSLFALCNQLVALSASTFYKALEWSNAPAWILSACVIIGLWFCGNVEMGVPGLSRLESRRRVILLFTALVVGFLSARICQAPVDRLRPIAAMPMEVPIDPQVWEQIKSVIEIQGSFPSDHGVLLAVITVGVFITSVRVGFIALLFNLFFSALRVGVGFHYPSDMLAGEIIGLIAAFSLLSFKPKIQDVLDKLY